MHVKIGAAENNRLVNVHKGDLLEIELDETPTAGYSWEVENLDGSLLGLQSNEYNLYEGAGVGGGGLRRMVFLVTGQGKGSIRLKNAQRWSGDIYQRFEVNINSQ